MPLQYVMPLDILVAICTLRSKLCKDILDLFVLFLFCFNWTDVLVSLDKYLISSSPSIQGSVRNIRSARSILQPFSM